MRFIIGHGNYSYNHEDCYYGVRKDCIAHWTGKQDQPTVWDIEHKASDTNHGAQKPIECMRRPIENNSRPGDPVYDPFLGSGTTLIAATITDRVALCLEIEPRYVDLTIRRWQGLTGQIACLGDQSFDEVAASHTTAVQPQTAG